MRLEHLCNIELAYQRELARSGKFVFIQSSTSADPYEHYQENGTVVGERLCGRVRWINQVGCKDNASEMPNVYGLIQTDDGAPIMFTMQSGDAPMPNSDGQVLTTTFEADDERYRWLNNTLCILDGIVDFTTTLIRGRIYACVK